MKKAKKLLVLLTVLILCLTVPVPASAAVKISAKNMTLIKGQSKTLKITGTKNKVKWSSSKKSVAAVTSKGKVTAKGKGTATITAKVDKKKYTCKVKVETPKLSKTSLTVAQGKTATLKLSGTTQKITWTSSNTKIATVTSKGVVKGIKSGSCTITATVSEKKYTCAVKVSGQANKVPVYGFSLNRYNIMLKEGESEKIDVYIMPENATDKTVKWTSSNKNVATVNSSGVVSGKSIGNATITAVCGGITASCDVEVIRNFNSQEAISKITYSSYPTEEGVVVIAKNNYKYPISLDVDCLYYSSNGTMIGKSSDDCIVLESGRKCALMCANPYDSSYNDAEYSSYKINFKADEIDVIGNASAIDCKGNFGVENVMVSVTNNGQRVSYTSVAVVFYKSGQVIGQESRYAEVNNVGTTDYLQFSFPYDKEYDTIYPDYFEIFVNSSYRYNWG